MSKEKKVVQAYSVEDVFEQVCEWLWDEDIAEVEEETGVTNVTLYAWRNGDVVSPHMRTLKLVASYFGYELQFVGKSQPKLKLRIVK